MTCIEIRDMMSAYIDGELNDFDKVRVEKHCDGCPFCTEELNTLKNIINELRRLNDYEVPEGIRDNIRDQINRKSVWETIKGVFTAAPSFRWQTAGVVLSAFLILMVFSGRLDEIVNNGIKEEVKTKEIVMKSNKIKKRTGEAVRTDRLVSNPGYKIHKKSSIASVKQPKVSSLLSERLEKSDFDKPMTLYSSKENEKSIERKAGLTGRIDLKSLKSTGFEMDKKIEEKVGTVVKDNLGSKAKEISVLSRNFVVSGRIISKNREGMKLGVKGANIVVIEKNGEAKAVQNITTDRKGNFTLILDKNEKYDINVIKKGYKTKTISNINDSKLNETEEIVIEK